MYRYFVCFELLELLVSFLVEFNLLLWDSICCNLVSTNTFSVASSPGYSHAACQCCMQKKRLSACVQHSLKSWEEPGDEAILLQYHSYCSYNNCYYLNCESTSRKNSQILFTMIIAIDIWMAIDTNTFKLD